MEEKLRTAFELLFEETTASTTELVKSTTERLRNEKTVKSVQRAVVYVNPDHHGSRMGKKKKKKKKKTKSWCCRRRRSSRERWTRLTLLLSLIHI